MRTGWVAGASYAAAAVEAAGFGTSGCGTAVADAAVAGPRSGPAMGPGEGLRSWGQCC